MKLALVGESYALRSPAAACQQTMNLMPQALDDPNEGAKNKWIAVGRAGYHLMGTLNSGHGDDVGCGVWSGGGRVFVVTYSAAAAGSTLWESGIGSYVPGNPSTGAISALSQQALPYPVGAPASNSPAQMFANGNQLMIVKDGWVWIDNGAGPQLAQFLLSGTCDTVTAGAGGTVTWDTGDQFPPSMTFITIDGVNYSCTYNSATSLTLLEDPGAQTGATWTAPFGDYVTAVTGFYLDGYFGVQRPVGDYTLQGTAIAGIGGARNITWVSGSFFDSLSTGDTFTFNGIARIVDTVFSPTQLSLTTAPGTTGAKAFTVSIPPDLGAQFNISHPGDGISWDPLDFATKEGYPDHLSSVLADHEQLFLFGYESMEAWQNTGNVLFPFQRIAGAMVKEGSIATYAPTAAAEKIYYLGGSARGTPVAYRLDGFTPTRISTHAEEAAWASSSDEASGAVCYSEVQDGHQLWVVNFLGALGTWVYDETASAMQGAPMWTQRAPWSGTAFTAWTLRYHTFVTTIAFVPGGEQTNWGSGPGLHICLDATNGNIYEENLAYFDDNGASQQWVRILPALYAQGKTQFFARMTLEMETTGLASAASITRSYSDDRGVTFGNGVNPIISGAGAIDASAQRVFWPSNGSSRVRNFKLTGNNGGNERICLIDLDLEMEVGDI